MWKHTVGIFYHSSATTENMLPLKQYIWENVWKYTSKQMLSVWPIRWTILHHMFYYLIFHFIPLCRILGLVITQTFTFSQSLVLWKCCLVPRWAFSLRYRNNDMSPKTLRDGGRGLGWQHPVNGFLNPYLVKQKLIVFLIFLLSKWYIFCQIGYIKHKAGRENWSWEHLHKCKTWELI